MEKAIFEEKQQFRQWWILLIMVISVSLSVYSFLQPGDSGSGNSLWPTLLLILAMSSIFIAKLQTRIDEQGIHVKFFPFHFSFRTYTWEDINMTEVTNYSPIRDYGGWGYRISFKGKGKAYSVCGKKGIWLETYSGKKRMIGTQKAEEANTVIQSYLNKN